MKPPEFLRVLPADVGRVGPLGACILAVVRYQTALPGENKDDGRRIVDNETWWRGSHDDVGRLVGDVHRKSIGRALAKLESVGELLSTASKDYSDRAKLYRVPDQPLDKGGHRSDQPLDTTGQSIGQKWPLSLDGSGHSDWTEVATLPITEELEELEEPPDPPNDQTSLAPLPARRTGSDIVRAKFSATPVAENSAFAKRIARAYSDSLPVPIEAGVLAKIGIEADRCLRSQIPVEAIAAGIREWANSDSWSPSQIPIFVAKAAARAGRTTSGVGKPTEKALGYRAAGEALIARLETA